jgi:hypothetical protein
MLKIRAATEDDAALIASMIRLCFAQPAEVLRIDEIP